MLSLKGLCALMFRAGGIAPRFGLTTTAGTKGARGRSMCLGSCENYATRMLLTGMWTIEKVSFMRAFGHAIGPTKFDEIANSSHHHKANADCLRYLDEFSFVG